MSRSAVEIVRTYGVDAWNEGRDDWIPQLCADPIIRHDANREVRLSHAEQRARMRHNYEELRPVFEPIVLAGDDEYVTLVWNVTGRDPNWKLCGIEIFRVVGGLITEVWNSTYMDGRWGLSKSLATSVAGGRAVPLPLVRADVATAQRRVGGQLLVPADSQGLASWLTLLFGKPASTAEGTRWRHHFTPRGTPKPMMLTLADTAGPSIGLANVEVTGLAIELERSGLVNATVDFAADETETVASGPLPVLSPTRLSETVGTFKSDLVPEARVVNAAITISPDGSAHGAVSLRLDDPGAAHGEGSLSLGWRDGERMVMFEGRARLSEPTDVFEEHQTVQAAYGWEGTSFSALLINDCSDAIGADI